MSECRGFGSTRTFLGGPRNRDASLWSATVASAASPVRIVSPRLDAFITGAPVTVEVRVSKTEGRPRGTLDRKQIDRRFKRTGPGTWTARLRPVSSTGSAFDRAVIGIHSRRPMRRTAGDRVGAWSSRRASRSKPCRRSSASSSPRHASGGASASSARLHKHSFAKVPVGWECAGQCLRSPARRPLGCPYPS